MEFLEFSGPRIFLSWNVPSGNFLSRDFVSRKILAFMQVIQLLSVIDGKKGRLANVKNKDDTTITVQNIAHKICQCNP